MLHITDRFWSLILHEIKESGYFNDIAREIIVKEMNRIKVQFQFWQDKDQTWGHISLMGQDKLKVLQFLILARSYHFYRQMQLGCYGMDFMTYI